MLAGASGYASAGKCSNSFNHMFQPDGQTEKEIEKKKISREKSAVSAGARGHGLRFAVLPRRSRKRYFFTE
jgi:hypothetical protein